MPDAIQRLKDYLKQSFDVLPDKLPRLSPDKLPRLSKHDYTVLDYSVDRFGLAYHKTRTLGPDEIVLLRQVVRWSGMHQIGVKPTTEQAEQIDRWSKKTGVTWTKGVNLSAEQYAPRWLSENNVIMDEKPQPRALNEKFAGEPYLRQNLDFDKWLSPAQKEAVWTVLNLPEGSTCTIVLPTGCGKSSCFWLLPTFTEGLTVVVVPTVALAMDQQQNATDRFKHFPGVNPDFFASDDNPEVTKVKLKNRESRLVFASPETCVSGQLRPILSELARDGWFQNLVVDEAHIIETWGAEFRVEFQILSAVQKEWLKESEGKLRTFLFSATMSPGCRESLREMFSEENHVQEIICQRLRPEMKYFSKQFKDDKGRWPNLLEAIWWLPRPAILYVTRPKYADGLYDRLREEEFQRIGCFTGETGQSERKTLLEDWKNDKIDLMVATSAFGLGVDKADVRTVIHACYPENLDRYYQEVGRSGRDGYSSICLLMPTIEDRETARELGVKLMTKESVQERWEALYKSSRKSDEDDEYTFELEIEAKRMSLVGTRTYSENARWNKRLLMQLRRAKLIEFLDLKWEKSNDLEEVLKEWAKVKVDFAPGTRQLGELISPQREKELEYFRKGREQLEKLLTSDCCVSRVLRALYNVPSDQRVCGGCHYCRKDNREAKHCPRLHILERGHVSNGTKGTIIECWPDPTQSSQKEDFIKKIEECRGKHCLKPFQLYCLEDHFEEILSLIKEVFLQYREPYRIDPFDKYTFMRSYTNNSPIFLHIGKYSEEMLAEAKRTYSPNHLFCGIQNPCEPNGRHIMIKYNCNSRPSPEAWLQQLI